MSKPLLGAHVSAAGGLVNAIVRAEELGTEAIQIFGASPRQWRAMLPTAGVVKEYKAALAGSSVQAVYLHAAYLVNLATTESALRQKSLANLTKHLEIANLLDADGLIFHLGSSTKVGDGSPVVRVVEGVREVLDRVHEGKARLIMENSSGGGGKVGATMEELAALARGVRSKKVGFCLDTAHVFEAGQLRYEPKAIKAFFDRWEDEIGMDQLFVLHANDSKTDFGSYSDRHENLGEGKIGLAGLRNLAREKRIYSKAWLLEVPGFDNRGPDKKNLDVMKSLFDRNGR